MALEDIVVKDSTNRSVTVRIIDDTAGTNENSVAFNTSGITMWYRREAAAIVDITEVTLAALTTAHADGGFLYVRDGVYRLDLPDAAVADGAEYVDFGGTVPDMIVIGGRIRLIDVNIEDSVRAGLTALPNAAADAAGGLPISDAGGKDIDAALASITAIEVDTSTTLDGKINTIDGIVDAILVDTATTLDGKIDVIDGIVDSILVDTGTTLDGIVDAILVDTGTTLQAEVDAIQAAVITNAAGSDIAADIIALKAETATIVADTNELQTDDIPGTLTTILADTNELQSDDIPGTLTTILADTNELQSDDVPGLIAALDTATAAAVADAVWDEAQSAHTSAGTFGVLASEIATIDGIVDAILVDTGTTLDGKINTIDGIVDSILVDSGTTLQAELDAIQAAVITNAAGSDIAADIIAAKAVIDSILTDTGTTLPTTLATLSTTADLLDKVGAVNESAAAGDPSTTESVIQYIKQVINILIGSAGVASFPAEAAPSNAVSLAEVIRAIHADVTGIAGVAMRGTDSAALASVATETRLAELDSGNLPANIDTIDGIVDAILVDTADMQPRVAAIEVDTGTTLDGKINTIDTNVDSILVDTGTTLQGELDGIQADTEDIQSKIGSPAANVSADIAAAKVDTAAILVDTGTTLPGTLTTILADSNELQGDWTNGGRLDLLLDATLADTSEVQAELANGGRTDLLIDAIKAKTDSLPTGVARAVELANFPFLMVDASDFATPETSLTVVEEISKDGGSFAAMSNTFAEIGDGIYKITITATEMDAHTIVLKFTASGAAQRTMILVTDL